MIGTIAFLTLLQGASSPDAPQWLTLTNGVTIRYEERGAPEAPSLVFLHGYTDSHQAFERLTAALPGHLRTIVIDLRGHGDSDRPGRYAIADFADDVVRFMEAKRLRAVTVVGHSLGSLVAREVARRGRDRVSRLVLIGSATTFDNPMVRELRTAVFALGDAIDVEFIEAFQRSTVHTPVPDAFLARVIAASARVSPTTWRKALNAQIEFNDGARLDRLRLPTLLLRGARDEIATHDDQVRLLDGIPGAYLVSYPDLGHAPHWERPELVAADLLAFLAWGQDDVERR